MKETLEFILNQMEKKEFDKEDREITGWGSEYNECSICHSSITHKKDCNYKKAMNMLEKLIKEN